MKYLKKWHYELCQLHRNIKLKERLLIVYTVCGIIPLVAVSVYFSNGTNNTLINQSEQSEFVELSLIQDALNENIRVVTDVSKKLYFDEEIEHIAFYNYNSYKELLTDYRNYTRFSEYLTDYHQEISSITMYLTNKTIANSGSFVYADQNIRNSKWYNDTISADGKPIWSYTYSNVTMKNSLRLTRVIKTAEGKTVGVLSIVMQNKRTELPISNRTNKTAMLLNDEEVIHTNDDEIDVKELIKLVQSMPEDENESYKKVTYNDETCILTYERIHPTYSDSYFTIVSIRPYSEILAATDRSKRTGFMFIIICVSLSLILIITFSHKFSHRVNILKREMHKAANGDFHIETVLGQNDEISELYEDLHKMIDSIQVLMSKIVEEQVQKEKIYSRQKDVEFKMLASQINPHFLYNTLETIRMKARVNNQSDIEELVKMLAKIMRRNIQVGDRFVSIKSEIELVEYYLKIQHYRFGDRIQYEIEVEKELENRPILPLLIQPIVENAFVHGLESKEGPGILKIAVKEENKVIKIIVEDNGIGIKDTYLEELLASMNDLDELDKSHIGLSNVNQRIKLLYGMEYGVTIETVENQGTTVVIAIPIEAD
ncbi:MAG: sensor histidine kinase [bacterium]|nr:sensor histidine kinase [bacterium]